MIEHEISNVMHIVSKQVFIIQISWVQICAMTIKEYTDSFDKRSPLKNYYINTIEHSSLLKHLKVVP